LEADKGRVGVYDTIKTANYVDGIIGTYRTLEAQEQIDAQQKAIIADVKSRLTGNREYQDRLRSMEDELYRGSTKEDIETSVSTPTDAAWGDGISEQDLKMPAKISSSTPKAAPNKGKKMKASMDSQEGNLKDEVNEIKEVLVQLSMCVGELVEEKKRQSAGGANLGTTSKTRREPDPDSEDTSEEESISRTPVKIKRRQGPAIPTKKPPKPKKKDYYAVARGRIPGVYRDWGAAEKQVNGFRGSLHKKFSTRARAQGFVDEHRIDENSEEEDSELESANSDSNVSSDEEDFKPLKVKPPKTSTSSRTRKSRGGHRISASRTHSS
jgi:hypothetical protein